MTGLAAVQERLKKGRQPWARHPPQADFGGHKPSPGPRASSRVRRLFLPRSSYSFAAASAMWWASIAALIISERRGAVVWTLSGAGDDPPPTPLWISVGSGPRKIARTRGCRPARLPTRVGGETDRCVERTIRCDGAKMRRIERQEWLQPLQEVQGQGAHGVEDQQPSEIYRPGNGDLLPVQGQVQPFGRISAKAPRALHPASRHPPGVKFS